MLCREFYVNYNEVSDLQSCPFLVANKKREQEREKRKEEQIACA